MDSGNARIGRSRPDTRYPIPDIRLSDSSSSDSFLEKPDNLTSCCVSLEARLFKDRNTVKHDLEPAVARRNHFDLSIWKPLLQLSRQTGGSGFVVSNRAILYRDPHRRASGSFQCKGIRKYLVR